jgi:hypothetical protein
MPVQPTGIHGCQTGFGNYPLYGLSQNVDSTICMREGDYDE